MYGQICDCCEERRATFQVNKITARTDKTTGNIETSSRDEDWCEESVKHHWPDEEPTVGSTMTEKGEWWQGKRGGTFTATYTIEDAPRPANWRLVPACPCCGEEWIAGHVCTGCTNPQHNHPNLQEVAS